MPKVQIIQFPAKSEYDVDYELYNEVLKRKYEKTGIDYHKLYIGTESERNFEKAKQQKLKRKQKLETWNEEL